MGKQWQIEDFEFNIMNVVFLADLFDDAVKNGHCLARK